MGRTVEKISEGENFTVVQQSRNANSPRTTVFEIDGTTGVTSMSAAPVVNGATQFTATGYIQTVVTGVASPGHVNITGAKVGDKVISVVDLTTPAEDSSDWETTVSVAGQLQRTSGSATDKYLVLIAKQS